MTATVRRRLALATALLLSLWAARLMNLTAFPPFVDEGVHIRFIEDGARLSPFVHGTQGRLLMLWWGALFAPQAAGGLIIARLITVLFILPGAAALIAIGFRAAGLSGGLLIGLVRIFSPYHAFFDRLFLADAYAASLTMVAVWLGWRAQTQTRLREAALLGAAIFAAIVAKVALLPALAIPFAAAIDLRKRTGWRAGLRWLAVALIAAGALTGAYIVGLAVIGQNPLGLIATHNPDPTAGIAERIWSSTAGLIDVLAGYLTPIGLAALALGCAVLVIRRQWYPLLILAVLTIPLLASMRQTSRYYEANVSLLLLSGALGWIMLLPRARPALAAAALVYGAAVWWPAESALSTEPAAFPFSQADVYEYVTAESSGFGLREAAALLDEADAERVIGLLANCDSLRFGTPALPQIECPAINPSGASMDVLRVLVREAASAPGAYVIIEEIIYIPQDAALLAGGELIARISRPNGGPTLALYRLPASNAAPP